MQMIQKRWAVEAAVVFAVVWSMMMCGHLYAQEKPKADPPKPAAATAPVMSEADQLKLTLALTQRENLALKIQMAQTQLEQATKALQDLIGGLQKPGFDLIQDKDGKFVYQPKPPAEPKK